MESIKRTITIEEYTDGTFGCPELNLVGYSEPMELMEDIKSKIW